MNYKVTYAIDSLDTKPVIRTFDEEYEALEWLENEVQERIDYTVQHSPFTVSEEEYKEIEEYENSMYKIEEITNNGLKLIKGWINSNIQSFT